MGGKKSFPEAKTSGDDEEEKGGGSDFGTQEHIKNGVLDALGCWRNGLRGQLSPLSRKGITIYRTIETQQKKGKKIRGY